MRIQTNPSVNLLSAQCPCIHIKKHYLVKRIIYMPQYSDKNKNLRNKTEGMSELMIEIFSYPRTIALHKAKT